MPEPTVRITNLPARSTVDRASLIAVVDLATNTTVRLSLSRIAEILGLADEDMIGLLQSTSDAARSRADQALAAVDDMQDGVTEFDGFALLVEANGNVLLRATDDGLDFIPSQKVSGRIAEKLGDTVATTEGRAMLLDAAGNVLLTARRTGLDFIPSDELKLRLGGAAKPGSIYGRVDDEGREANGFFTERGLIEERVAVENRELLRGGPSQQNVEVDIITVNGQSLSVGDHFTVQSNIPTFTDADDVFVVDGLIDLANAVTARGWLSRRYDATSPQDRGRGIGLRPFTLGYGGGSGPIATAALGACGALNHHRREVGGKLASVVTICHGYNGVAIENMDNSSATGNGETTVWDNLVYWYAEAKRALDAMGVGYRVPWHVLVHGTSAKNDESPFYYNSVLNYMDRLRLHLLTNGFSGEARLILTQSGGDANTAQSGEVWDVVLDQLRLAQEGRAVLAGPLYPHPIADNNVHPDGENTTRFGEVIARAMSEIEAGRGWPTLGPKDWRLEQQGADWIVTITFDARADEALETESSTKYRYGTISSFGFEAEGASIRFTPEVVGHTVKLTLNAPPTAIRYAMQQQDVTGINDGYTAHRGLLRSNYRWAPKFINGWLHRWVPSFRIQFSNSQIPQ